MYGQASAIAPAPRKRVPTSVAIFVITIIVVATVYANLSLFVTDSRDYRIFPPFEPHINLNMNDHLGGENLNIAQALLAGEGFAHPFRDKTGPTAWTPPVFPALLAALLWLCGGNVDAVASIVVFLQMCVLVGTGLLVAALARQTIEWKWTIGDRQIDLSQAVAVIVFLTSVILDFFLWFQFTHDVWLVLLLLDLLLIGFYWGRPLEGSGRAACWGLFGGLCALTNPIVAFAWGILTFFSTLDRRAWRQFVLAGLVAAATVAPWIVRNYLVFGCLVPVKSNVAFELFQSQCLTEDGLIVGQTFEAHPYSSPGLERQKYGELGEIAYLQLKADLFRQDVQADPWNFARRLGQRFVAVTVWYAPFSIIEQEKAPRWAVFMRRLTYPLPWLACAWLVITSLWQGLRGIQWLVIGLYVLYLVPYVTISFYDRYAAPLLAVKMLLVIWGIDRLVAVCKCACAARSSYVQDASTAASVGQELVAP